MKKLLVALMLVAFAATIAIAADSVTLKAKNGDVTFSHKAHGEKNACTVCHADAKGGKLELDKDSGHALCKDCHTKGGAGPTKCGDCHKK